MIRSTLYPVLAALLLAIPAGASADAATDKIYDKSCKNCHGADGKAQTKMGKKHEIDSFADAAWQAKHSDDELRDAITNGVPKTKMKAYKDKLTAEQITALVAKVRSFAPATGETRSPEK